VPRIATTDRIAIIAPALIASPLKVKIGISSILSLLGFAQQQIIWHYWLQIRTETTPLARKHATAFSI
jgi:hypothetical protein